MMIKKFIFRTAVFSFAALIFAACGSTEQAAETEATDSLQTEEVLATEAAPEVKEEMPADLTERPSPPDSAVAKVGDLELGIYYSRPSLRGRTVWGDLVPYNEIWRTGANEATIFSVSQNVTIGGKELPAGKYALFSIPTQSDWTLIFNKVYDQWGSFKYEEAQDALRVTAKSTKVSESMEKLLFTAKPAGNAVKVSLQWEKVKVDFTVNK